MLLRHALAALTLLATAAAPRAETGMVDVSLMIAVDISASVDAEEYRLQMTGLAAALKSSEVLEAIRSGPQKSVAIAVMQWSGVRTQHNVVPWTIVDDEQSLGELALSVLKTERANEGGATSISAALVQARKAFAWAPPSHRKAIDVSVDGINNIGPPLDEARAEALSEGITINGLAISNEWRGLDQYLETNVIGGPGSFALEAKSYRDFGAVMLRKLVREIQRPGQV